MISDDDEICPRIRPYQPKLFLHQARAGVFVGLGTKNSFSFLPCLLSLHPLTTPGLGQKVNPTVTLNTKKRSPSILSSIERLCELYPCSPTRIKDNPLQRCSKFSLVPVFYPSAKIHSCVLLSSRPSWIPSLPAILTPVLRTCHLFTTTCAALGACLSTDPI